METLKKEYLPHYVYEDYVQWEGRWEIIQGIPYSMAPSPTYHHQSINGNIFFQLKQLLADCTKCQVLFPIDYKIDNQTVVQPDALVVCEPFEKGAFLQKTPEIVFEILSDSTRNKDLGFKFSVYEKAGVKHYVIIDPLNKTCSVFQTVGGVYKLMLRTEDESFDFNIMPCPFRFDFGKVW